MHALLCIDDKEFVKNAVIGRIVSQSFNSKLNTLISLHTVLVQFLGFASKLPLFKASASQSSIIIHYYSEGRSDPNNSFLMKMEK